MLYGQWQNSIAKINIDREMFLGVEDGQTSGNWKLRYRRIYKPLEHAMLSLLIPFK